MGMKLTGMQSELLLIVSCSSFIVNHLWLLQTVTETDQSSIALVRQQRRGAQSYRTEAGTVHRSITVIVVELQTATGHRTEAGLDSREETDRAAGESRQWQDVRSKRQRLETMINLVAVLTPNAYSRMFDRSVERFEFT